MHFYIDIPETEAAKAKAQAAAKPPAVIEVDYFVTDLRAVVAAEVERRTEAGEDMSNYVVRQVVADADRADVASIGFKLTRWMHTKDADDHRSIFDVLAELKRECRPA